MTVSGTFYQNTAGSTDPATGLKHPAGPELLLSIQGRKAHIHLTEGLEMTTVSFPHDLGAPVTKDGAVLSSWRQIVSDIKAQISNKGNFFKLGSTLQIQMALKHNMPDETWE